ISESQKLGDALSEKLELDISQIEKSKFKIIRWQELYEKDDFVFHRKKIETCYQQNTFFADNINEIAKNYLAKQEKKGEKISIEYKKALKLSIAYLIEELSIFDML